MEESLTVAAVEDLLNERLFTSAEGRRNLETVLLPPYVTTRRWFAGKARRWERFEVLQMLALGGAHLLLLGVRYSDGGAETYLLPLKLSDASPSMSVPEAVVARGGGHELLDAVYDPIFRADLLALIGANGRVTHDDGELIGIQGTLLKETGTNLNSRVLEVEQSNSSIIYGDRIFLKLYRKLEEGINPDAEITRFLTERRHFQQVAPFAGALEYHARGEEPRMFALALGMVPNQGDAWAFTLRQLEIFYERTLTAKPPSAAALPGEYLHSACLLGKRTGELHVALAGDAADPVFAPEPFDMADQRDLARSVRDSVEQTFQLLAASNHFSGGPNETLIKALLSARGEIVEHTRRFEAEPIRTSKTRTHGDYHLGQILHTGTDFVIIDFEGEPLRPLAWRKLKRSPLRDLAGMLRSFHYAAHSALASFEAHRDVLDPYADDWSRAVGDAFLTAWRQTTATAAFGPRATPEFEALLKMFLLEKVIYEVGYELNNRPDWLPIPARGALALLRAC